MMRTMLIAISALAAVVLPVAAFAAPDESPQAPPAWDWANFTRYRQANSRLGLPAPGEKRVVFIGTSVIENWGQDFQGMFPGKPYINRGIGGQTAGQVLLRFRQDAIDLKPAVVIIYPGVNDIASNRGPTVLKDIESSLMSMVDLARAHKIRVIMASNGPVTHIPWAGDLQPAETVRSLNAWIRDYAKANGLVYLDFENGLKDENGVFNADWASDGVHPTTAGYRVMAPLTQVAIDKALKKR